MSYASFMNLARILSTNGKYRVGKKKLQWDDWKLGSPDTRIYIKLDPCSYCGGVGGTIDHIHPRSRANYDLGTGFDRFHWTNYTGACEECNVRKNSMGLVEFLIKFPIGGP